MNQYLRNLKRIEFSITLACTGRCIHCQNGENLDRTCHIDTAIAVDAIGKITRFHDISSVMTFGGEPLLYPDTVCAIHSAAREAGIPKRQLITNGYFTKDSARREEIAFELAEAGVNNLLISADAFHQRDIPLDIVKHFAEASVRAGIPVTISPAWLVSRADSNPYNIQTHEILDELIGLEGVIEGQGNIIFPAGNALKYLGDYFDFDEAPVDPYDEDPENLTSISFSANGDVLDGNINEADILEIMDQYDPRR